MVGYRCAGHKGGFFLSFYCSFLPSVPWAVSKDHLFLINITPEYLHQNDERVGPLESCQIKEEAECQGLSQSKIFKCYGCVPPRALTFGGTDTNEASSVIAHLIDVIA